jgi:hypothetical protein
MDGSEVDIRDLPWAAAKATRPASSSNRTRRRLADQATRTLNLADDFIRLAKARSDNYRFEDIGLAHVALDATDAVSGASGVGLGLLLVDEPRLRDED